MGFFTVSVWEYLSRITSLVLSFVFLFGYFFQSDTFPFPNMIVHLRFTLKHSGLCSVILSGYYGIYLQTWRPFKLKTWNFCQKISFKAYVLFPATIQTGTEVYWWTDVCMNLVMRVTRALPQELQLYKFSGE